VRARAVLWRLLRIAFKFFADSGRVWRPRRRVLVVFGDFLRSRGNGGGRRVRELGGGGEAVMGGLAARETLGV
jgi:hypothetical protein